VDGLNDIVVSLETAEPEEAEEGVNKIGWKALAFPALFTATFWEVAADPETPIQVKFPDVSDCKTDVPEPGKFVGRVYNVFVAVTPALNPI
jgi:hypothetical protein